MDTRQDVLFSFDDYSIEGTRGVKLEMVTPEKHEGNPILERGKVGGPDAFRCGATMGVFYDEGIWKMWYVAWSGRREAEYAQNDDGIGGDLDTLQTGSPGVCYAESDDGITWEKPKLGLVAYRGTTQNNIVKTIRPLNMLSILCDKDAPPEHRYIMAGEDISFWGGCSLDAPSLTRIDVSSDGFRWTPLRDEPGIIPQWNETSTIYKFRGRYHIGSHQESPLLRLPLQTFDKASGNGPRTFCIWRSPRIDKWPIESTKAFFKPMRSSSPYVEGWDREEVHAGASVTAYRNVCLGVCGQWHHPIIFNEKGAPAYDAPAVSVDLGLVISNDGLHFREPAPGFTFIGRDQELRWDRDYRDNKDKDNILLVQGSMINTDQLTHIYYSASTPHGNTVDAKSNIGLATLSRDRFGYLSLIDDRGTGGFVTCPLSYDTNMRLYVNTDVPKDSSLQFLLLDEHGLDVLQGYGKLEGGLITESGLDVAVTWKDKCLLPKGEAFRIRCEMKGKAKTFALYVKEA